MRRKHSKHEFENVAEIFPRFLHNWAKKCDTKTKAQFLSEYKEQYLFWKWEELVGKDIAHNIIPQAVSFKVLWVYATSPVWSMNFNYLKLDIIEKLNQEFGEGFITDIKFTRQKQHKYQESRKSRDDNTWKEQLAQLELTAPQQKQIHEAVSQVEDAELQEKLQQLYRKSMLVREVKINDKWHPCTGCNTLIAPEETLCINCLRQEKAKQRKKIREILAIMPWARYQDIQKYVSCDKLLVDNIRAQLVQEKARELVRGVDYPKNFKEEFWFSDKVIYVVCLNKIVAKKDLSETLIRDTLYALRFDTTYWVKDE